MSTEIDSAAASWIVDRSTLTRDTSPTTRRTLADVGRIRTLERNEWLVRYGEQAATLALVGKGDLRLRRPAVNGALRVTGYRGPGEVVGEAALGGVAVHTESAIAMNEVQAVCVPVGVVAELVTKDAAFCRAVLRVLVARHHAAEDQLAAVLRSSVEERLAAFLLAAAARWGRPEPGGVRITALLTHLEMAGAVGSSRETITLTLSNLRRVGVIAHHRRQVIILRRDALVARAGAAGAAHREGDAR
jgi:CRP/FNR family transcriptional regulator, cyclic AMP receptor protein